MKRPDLSRVPAFPQQYINLVTGDDLNSLLNEQIQSTNAFLQNIPEARWTFQYAPDKWTIKEVVQHLIDTERILSYRALCMARGETASLPGFDENNYAAASKAGQRTKEHLLEELKAVQQATTYLFHSFDEEQLERSGIANGASNYVRALGFIVIGHVLHHIRILKEKYLY